MGSMPKLGLSKIKLFEANISEEKSVSPKVASIEFAEAIKRFLKSKGFKELNDGDYELPSGKIFRITQKIEDEEGDIFICEVTLMIKGFRFEKGYFLPFGSVDMIVEPASSTREEIVISEIQEIILKKIQSHRFNFYTFNFNTSLEHVSDIREYVEGTSPHFWHEHYIINFTGNKICEIISNHTPPEKGIVTLIKEKISSDEEVSNAIQGVIKEKYSQIVKDSGKRQQIIINNLLDAIIKDIAFITVKAFEVVNSWLTDFVIELNDFDIFIPEQSNEV
jgi:hypothetical protein